MCQSLVKNIMIIGIIGTVEYDSSPIFQNLKWSNIILSDNNKKITIDIE
jgi:hypothetical protein